MRKIEITVKGPVKSGKSTIIAACQMAIAQLNQSIPGGHREVVFIEKSVLKNRRVVVRKDPLPEVGWRLVIFTRRQA